MLVLCSKPAGAGAGHFVQLESAFPASTLLSAVHPRQLLATYVAEEAVIHIETSVSRALQASLREQLAQAQVADSVETAQAMRNFAAMQEA